MLMPIHRFCNDNILLLSTLVYIAGAGLVRYLPISLAPQPVMLFALIFGLALFLFSILFPHKKKVHLALPLFFLIGFAHTYNGTHPSLSDNHIASLIHTRTKATLVGTLVTMPEFYSEKTRFNLQLKEVLIHTTPGTGSFIPSQGKIRLSIRDILPESFVPGMEMMVIAEIDRIRANGTPGAFDYKEFMAVEKIYCTGSISSLAAIKPLITAQPLLTRLSYFPEKTRHTIAGFLQNHLPKEQAALYQALLIGSKAALSQETREQFKAGGCMHLLAISGLHIGLLGAMGTLLFSFLLKRSSWLLLHIHVPTLAMALTLPLLIGYALIAGLNIPVIRAVLMAVIVIFALFSRRERTILPIIAAAALLTLAISPLSLFTASFQLSFAAVTAIGIIYPRLLEYFTSQSSQHLIQRFKTYLIGFLLVSIAATLGTLPFMLYHFNRFSLVGPILNLIIEPLLCFWALPFGLLAIPIIGIMPESATMLLHAGGIGLDLAITILSRVASLPFASLWTITPTLFEIVVYLGIIGLLLLAQKGKLIRTATLALSLILILSFTRGIFPIPRRLEDSIHFIDVGQGTSTLIRFKDNKTILLDGGGGYSSSFNVGRSLIAPYLWKQRIWKLDAVIVTHPHSDHYNGLPFIFEHFKPKRLYIGKQKSEEWRYRKLLEQAQELKMEKIILSRGDVVHSSPARTLRCLGMTGLEQPDISTSVNDTSLVLKLAINDKSLLFPADISRRAEKKLLKTQDNLEADILLAPHHGSNSSSSRQFIDAVKPKVIVVSSGHSFYGNKPSFENIRVWNEKNIAIQVTSLDGTIICTPSLKPLCRNTLERN